MSTCIPCGLEFPDAVALVEHVEEAHHGEPVLADEVGEEQRAHNQRLLNLWVFGFAAGAGTVLGNFGASKEAVNLSIHLAVNRMVADPAFAETLLPRLEQILADPDPFTPDDDDDGWEEFVVRGPW